MATKKLDELEKERAASSGTTQGTAPITVYKASQNSSMGTGAAENTRTAALQEYLRNAVGGTPTESDILKGVRDQLLNREKFSYDHNADSGFQQYLNTAKKNGKLAMRDTIGQASAMTGGYGNSYAQTAGQIAYNDYMQDANEMIPEFEELARARYDAETAALTDKYSILKSEHEAELEDYRNRYDIAREDWYKEQDRIESERQYEDEKKQREIELLLAMGDYDSIDRMGYNTSSLRAKEAAEVSDEADDFKLWNYSGIDEDSGFAVYYDDNGKKKTVEVGLNPYTGTQNPDTKNGTFKNGYQPDNVGGSKLSKSGLTDEVNGRTQSVWIDENNMAWIWDGSKNRYEEYTIDGRQATAGMISNLLKRQG